MAVRDDIVALMDEVSSGLGGAEATGGAGSAAWRLGTDFLITYVPETDRLAFRIGLGRPDPAARETLYGLLLAYNGQSAETGGGLVGLTAPDGEIRLHHAVPAAGLTADLLRGLIADLLGVANGWRACVRHRAAGPTGPDLELLRFQAIRG